MSQASTNNLLKIKWYGVDGTLHELLPNEGIVSTEANVVVMGFPDIGYAYGTKIEVTNDLQGVWSSVRPMPGFVGAADKPAYQIPVQLLEGSGNLWIRVVRSDGSVESIIQIPTLVDVTAPVKPIVQSINWSNYDNLSGMAQVHANGTAEAGSKVNLYTNRQTLTSAAGYASHLFASVVADANGRWSLDQWSSIDQGKLSFSAVASDSVGWESLRSDLFVLDGPQRTGLLSIPVGYQSDMKRMRDMYLGRNPEASSVAKTFVEQLIQAWGHIRASGLGAKLFTQTDFQNCAVKQNWSTEAVAGAYLLGSKGIYGILDQFGEYVGATPYGNKEVSPAHLRNWLRDDSGSTVPQTTQDTLKLLNAAAISSALSKGSLEGVSSDVLSNPGKYSAAQKAALAFHLQQVMQGIDSLYHAGDWNRVWYLKEFHPRKPTEYISGIKQALSILYNDESVQKYIQDGYKEELRSLVRGNLYVELNKYLSEIESHAGVAKVFNQNVIDGKLGGALLRWAEEINTLQTALFKPNEEMPALATVLKQDNFYDRAQKYYVEKIVSADFLRDRIKAGVSFDQAMSEMGAESAGLMAVLDSKAINPYVEAARNNLMTATTEILIAQMEGGVFNAWFLNNAGEIDPVKFNNLISALDGKYPEFFDGQDGYKFSAKELTKLAQTMWDQAGRSPQKFGESFTKIFSTINKEFPDAGFAEFNPSFKPITAYSKGQMHVLSALFAGAGLASKALGGAAVDNPVLYAADGVKAISTFLEGTTKYAKFAKDATDISSYSVDQLSAHKSAIKNWGIGGNFAKGLGGAASVVGGVFGIIDGAQSIHEDPVNAGFALTSGVLGTLSGVAAIGEASTGILASLTSGTLASAMTISSSVAATAGSVLGIASGVVTAAGMLVSGIMATIAHNDLIESDKRKTAYVDNLLNEMNIYGVKSAASAEIRIANGGDAYLNANESYVDISVDIKVSEYASVGDIVYISPRIEVYDKYLGLAQWKNQYTASYYRWETSTIYAKYVLTKADVQNGSATVRVNKSVLSSASEQLKAYVFHQNEGDGIDTNVPGGNRDLVAYKPYGTSDAITLTVDNLAPQDVRILAQQISPASLNAESPSPASLSASGTGESGSTVHILHGRTEIGFATVQSNGTWQVSAAKLSGAEYDGVLTVFEQDLAGNRSAVEVLTGAERKDYLVESGPQSMTVNRDYTLATTGGRLYDVVVDAYQSIEGKQGEVDVYWNGERVSSFVPLNTTGATTNVWQRFVVSVIGTGRDKLEIKTPVGDDGVATAVVAKTSLYDTWQVVDLTGNANANRLIGTAQDNVLQGLNGNDTLDGVSGNDWLMGGQGSDVYIAGLGGGQCVIVESSSPQQDQDVLALEGVSSVEQVWLSKENDDLLVNIYGRDDSVLLKNWYVDASYQVEEIHAAGAVLRTEQLQSLAVRMAAFDAPDSQGLTAFSARSALTDSYATLWSGATVTKGQYLTGGTGADVLLGGRGADLLDGLTGSDTLSGEAGADLFVMNGPGLGVTTVRDFNPQEGDQLVLNSTLFKGLDKSDQLNDFIRQDTQAASGSDYLVYVPTTGELYYDATGKGSGKAGVLFAILQNKPNDLGSAQLSIVDDTKVGVVTGGGSGGGTVSLVATDGNDSLLGGGGADTLNGKLGNDILTGGGGADSFVFSTQLGSSNVDTITDFSLADKDKIVLDNAVFTRLREGRLSINNFRLTSQTPNAFDDYIIYDPIAKNLYYNETGGFGNGVLFAQLPNLPAPSFGVPGFNAANVEFTVI